MKLINKYTHLNFPPQFKIISLNLNNNNNKIFYCYDNKYFYRFSADNFYIDKELNSVIIFNKKFKINFYSINFFKKFIKSLNCYFYIKIKFKGKGYKIKYIKRKKKITFYFGRSHLTIIKYKKIILKKYLKYKFIIKSNNLEILKKNAKITTNVKPLNIFTLRGIRQSRSLIYKRKGKKGSYI